MKFCNFLYVVSILHSSVKILSLCLNLLKNVLFPFNSYIYIFQSKIFLFLYWHGSDSSIWKPIFELWYKKINHYVSQFKIWNVHILPHFFFLVINFKNLYDMFNWWPVSLFDHTDSESEWHNYFMCVSTGLVCCGSWGRKESDMTERLNWTEINKCISLGSMCHLPAQTAVNALSRLLQLPFVWLGLWELNILL